MPPALGSLVQESHWQTGASPVEGHQVDEGARAYGVWKGIDRMGVVQSEEEKARGRNFVVAFNYLLSGYREDGARDTQWYYKRQ